MAQELEQPASDPDFLPSEAVITTKARVNVCRDAIFIILKRVAFLVGHSLLLCCALPWLSFAYLGHNYLHTYYYYQQNAGTYKNDSYYQKMYTICLSKYCAILLSYCLDGAFLLDFIDSTWTMVHAMTTWTFKIYFFFSFGPCFTILQIANFESNSPQSSFS